MFKDEYIPYLNFKPQNLVPKTEKDALLTHEKYEEIKKLFSL